MESKPKSAAAKAKNAYLRAWRAKNPDKVKAYNNAYWERKAAQMEAAEHENADDKRSGGEH